MCVLLVQLPQLLLQALPLRQHPFQLLLQLLHVALHARKVGEQAGGRAGGEDA